MSGRVNQGYYKNVPPHTYHSYDVVGLSIMDVDDKMKQPHELKVLSFMKQLNEKDKKLFQNKK
jgi:hypothetical protein